jgi:hypothetical protein
MPPARLARRRRGVGFVRRVLCAHRRDRSGRGLRASGVGQGEGPKVSRLRKLRPMIEADAPSTEGLLACFPRCARPTGGSHARITDNFAQRPNAKCEGRLGVKSARPRAVQRPQLRRGRYRSSSIPGGTIGTLPGVTSEISAGAPYFSINSAARSGEGTLRA